MADKPEATDDITPIPTKQLDKDLQEVLDRSLKFLKRINIGMGVAILVIVVVAAILIRQSWTEKSRVDDYLAGQCPFFSVLADLPVPPSTSSLGVELVEGARRAMAKQACTETVVPPSKELLILGRKYHIPITY